MWSGLAWRGLCHFTRVGSTARAGALWVQCAEGEAIRLCLSGGILNAAPALVPPGKTLFSPPAPDLVAGRMANGRQVTLSKLPERLRLPGLCLLPGGVLTDLRLPSFPASFLPSVLLTSPMLSVSVC